LPRLRGKHIDQGISPSGMSLGLGLLKRCVLQYGRQGLAAIPAEANPQKTQTNGQFQWRFHLAMEDFVGLG